MKTVTAICKDINVIVHDTNVIRYIDIQGIQVISLILAGEIVLNKNAVAIKCGISAGINQNRGQSREKIIRINSSIDCRINAVICKDEVVTASNGKRGNLIHAHTTINKLAPVNITQRQCCIDAIAAYKGIIAISHKDRIIKSIIICLAKIINCIVNQVQSIIVIGINTDASSINGSNIVNCIVENCDIVPSNVNASIMIQRKGLIKIKIEISQNNITGS